MTITQAGSPHSIAGRKQTSRPLEGGATFTLKHRLQRLLWQAAWLALAAWTPSCLWRWRGMVLNAFGADIHKSAIVRASAHIWWPGNLSMGAHSSLGPGAICYNVAPVTLAPSPLSRSARIFARQATISIRRAFPSLPHRFTSLPMAGWRQRLLSALAYILARVQCWVRAASASAIWMHGPFTQAIQQSPYASGAKTQIIQSTGFKE